MNKKAWKTIKLKIERKCLNPRFAKLVENYHKSNTKARNDLTIEHIGNIKVMIQNVYTKTSENMLLIFQKL